MDLVSSFVSRDAKRACDDRACALGMFAILVGRRDAAAFDASAGQLLSKGQVDASWLVEGEVEARARRIGRSLDLLSPDVGRLPDAAKHWCRQEHGVGDQPRCTSA